MMLDQWSEQTSANHAKNILLIPLKRLISNSTILMAVSKPFWKCWSWWALHATYAHVFACGLCLESVPRGKNNSLSFELIDQFMWSFTCICAVAENCLDVSKLILMRVKAAARLGMIVSEMLRRLYNFMLKNFVRSSQNQTDVRKGTTSSSSTNFLWLQNK